MVVVAEILLKSIKELHQRKRRIAVKNNVETFVLKFFYYIPNFLVFIISTVYTHTYCTNKIDAVLQNHVQCCNFYLLFFK